MFTYARIGAAIGALLFLLAVYGLGFSQGHKRSDREWAPKVSALETTIANVRATTVAAQLVDAENARRKEAAQSAANQENSLAYQTSLADLRARYDRLRATAAAANPGSGAGAPVSAPGTDTDGSDAAPASDGLLGYALAADENTLKLVALQKAVRERDEAFNAGR